MKHVLSRAWHGARSRPWLFVLACLVVATTLAAGGFWYVFVPNWRPPLSHAEHYGVDVSAHQDAIDWDSVAADNIDFAYIKASEGRDWVDSWFSVNWNETKRVGLDRGAYHFFTLCDPGEVQARNFLSVAPPTQGALPPAVDLELAANCHKRPRHDDVKRELNTFLAIVENAWKQKALLYVGSDWESHYPTQAQMKRPLWELRFMRRPTVNGWVLWQVHGFAHVDGISGGVDLDIMRANFPGNPHAMEPHFGTKLNKIVEAIDQNTTFKPEGSIKVASGANVQTEWCGCAQIGHIHTTRNQNPQPQRTPSRTTNRTNIHPANDR